MAATPAGARPRASTDLVGLALGAAGISLLLPGLLAFVAPGAFYDLLAPFPPQNDHILRDVGAFQVGFGLAALLAIRVEAFRLPMLGAVTVAFALHTISHVVNVSDTDPSWVGPV